MKVLVRFPNWVGDMVLATPFIRTLHEALPAADIIAAGRRPSIDLIYENPYISKIHVIRNRGLQEAKIMRSEGPFDFGFVLPPSFSSALFLKVAGAEIRVGYATDNRGMLLTHPVPVPDHPVHRATSFIELIGYLVKPAPEEVYGTEIYLVDKDFEKVNPIIKDVPRPIVVLNPNSEAPARRWPPIRWIELGKALIQKDITPIFIGSSFDVSRVSRIVKEIGDPRAINVAGKLNIRELAALLSLADVVVSNDTGPMHIAYTVGTKTIALFGAGDERITGPYKAPHAQVVRATDIDCEPCQKNYCPLGHKKCMWAITVEMVMDKLLEMLG